MTISYNSGRRIQGTSTDATAVSGGWKELARTTLGSAGDTITTSSLPNKRYYMVLVNPIMNGSTPQTSFRMGNSTIDTGGNYSWREERDGGTDVTGTNASWQTLVGYTANNAMDFAVMNIANLSGKEKLSNSHSVYGITGVGNAPHRTHNVAKWANTSNPLDTLQAFNSYLSEFAIGSEVVVLGWDEDDTHTDNFWEELASVTATGSTTSFNSGTFTAKKYLWVQGYFTSSGSFTPQIRVGNSTIDTGSNYAGRRSYDGNADVTATSQTEITLDGVGQNTPVFFNGFIVNNASKEKLAIFHCIKQNSAGAGNVPHRRETVFKWANTSNQINIIEFLASTGNIGSNGTMKVWGSN